VISVKRAHLRVAAITDPGRKGKNNEDRYAVAAHRLAQDDSTPSLFAIVADGVGGHHAGEVAAEMAIEIISRFVSESNGERPLETLNRAIQRANRSIYAQAADNLSQQGMSTTAACAWIIGERLYTSSVGDSRIYLMQDNSLKQLTIDHTWIQEAISSGLLRPDQAKDHPNAHVIRRHLGSRKPVLPDFRLRLNAGESDEEAEANQGLRLRPGDQVLICSDGLTDLVGDGEILAYLQSKRPETAVKDLVALANARGGHDNITIILLEALEQSYRTVNASKNPASNKLLFLTLGLGSLILLGSILIGSLFWFSRQIGPTLTPENSAAPLVQPQILTGEAMTGTIPPPATPLQGRTSTPPVLETLLTTAGETEVLPTYTPWPTSTPEP
jgi:serine/threonine protein phosphatase PrpC